MMLRATRVLAFFLVSTSACVLERGERWGNDGNTVPADPNGSSNDPNDPNCACPNGSGGRVDYTGVTQVVISGFDGRIDLDANASKPAVGWHTRGDVTVRTERKGSTVSIKADKSGFCGGCGVDFDAHLPPGLDVTLTTSNGEIHCSGAVHALDVATSNAKVVLASLSGTFTVSTSNGAIEGDDVTPNGNCSVSTSNGAITMTKLHTKDVQKIEGTTSNGDVCVSLEGFTIEKTKDHFVAASCSAATGSLTIDTSNGAICVSNL